MRVSAVALALACTLGSQVSAQAATASFDDLPALPELTAGTGLYYANNNSSSYAGVVWDSRFEVVGDSYRVVKSPPGPLYGIPHSGHYFVTNQGDGEANNGLSISTSLVLQGAWFGRNEYYGYGGGADQVTITALRGDVALLSLIFELPAAPAGPEGPGGQPAVLQFFDTGAFATLAGISGYRIDRRARNEFAGNWVADDFTFAAAVPEPRSYALLLAGLGLIAWVGRRSTS